MVLARAFCLVCCRALALLSATSSAVCLNCSFSASRFYGVLRSNRPGFFTGLELLSCLLHIMVFLCCCSSSDYLTVCTLSFILAIFCSSVAFLAIFSGDVTSHRLGSLASVSAQTWFSLSSQPSPSSPRTSQTCACTRRGPLNLERAVRVSDVVLLCSLGFLACGLASLDLLHVADNVGIVVLLLVLLGYFRFYNLLNFVVCDSTAFCAATSVVVSLSCLTSDELGFRIYLHVKNAVMLVRLVLVLYRLLDLSVILDWENACPARNVKSVDVVHHLLVHVNLLVPVSSCGFVIFFLSCWIPLKSL